MPDDEERLLVQRAYELAAGQGVAAATRYLERYASGARFWTTATVRRMLAKRTYLGEVRTGAIVNSNAHEPLVDRATWRAAQHKPGAYTPPCEYPLSGVAHCASCGQAMVAGPKSSTGRRMYRCVGAQTLAKARCLRPASIVADRLEEYVRAQADAVDSSPPGRRPRSRGRGRCARRLRRAARDQAGAEAAVIAGRRGCARSRQPGSARIGPRGLRADGSTRDGRGARLAASPANTSRASPANTSRAGRQTPRGRAARLRRRGSVGRRAGSSAPFRSFRARRRLSSAVPAWLGESWRVVLCVGEQMPSSPSAAPAMACRRVRRRARSRRAGLPRARALRRRRRRGRRRRVSRSRRPRWAPSWSVRWPARCSSGSRSSACSRSCSASRAAAGVVAGSVTVAALGVLCVPADSLVPPQPGSPVAPSSTAAAQAATGAPARNGLKRGTGEG